MTSEGSRYEASRAYVKLFKSPKKNGRRVRKVYYFFFFFSVYMGGTQRPSFLLALPECGNRQEVGANTLFSYVLSK